MIEEPWPGPRSSPSLILRLADRGDVLTIYSWSPTACGVRRAASGRGAGRSGSCPALTLDNLTFGGRRPAIWMRRNMRT